MSNTALQLAYSAATPVAGGHSILFNEVLFSSGDVTYNPASGEITFAQPGRYLFNWWAVTQALQGTSGPAFALSSSQGDYLVGNSPIKAGEIYGTGIIEVLSPPTTVRLVNAGTVTFYFPSTTSLNAFLLVFQEDPAGPTGPTGDTGPTGPAGTLADTSSCFAVSQLAHVLDQLITLYSTSVFSVFTNNAYTIVGTPDSLYTSPEGGGPGLLILTNAGQYESIPLTAINAVYTGDGTVYDPSITYLPSPTPLPLGCDTDMMTAVQDYLPIGTDVLLMMGLSTQASGLVYVNHYGMLVLSDADGNTPVFVVTPHLMRIVTEAAGLDGLRPTVSARIQNIPIN